MGQGVRALIPKLAGLWRDPPALLLLAFNLAPAVCVLLFGWSAGILLLVYWFENIVIGGFNALKMIISGVVAGPVGIGAAALATPFFIFHYGLFCLVHGVFVMVFVAMERRGLANVPNPEGLPAAMMDFVRDEPGFGWSLAAVIALQASLFLTEWVMKARWRQTNPISQMMEPYPRIIVLHITLFCAGFLVLALHGATAAVFALAVVKTAYDVGGRAGRKAEEKTVPMAVVSRWVRRAAHKTP